jgi:hypothetical protein
MIKNNYLIYKIIYNNIMDNYSIVKVIGDGTYGSVIKAMNKKTGEIVAIKKMKKKYFRWNLCVD